MTMNRVHNATNPYQGKAKRVLCVCSAGLLRSPTAAVVLNREFGFNTRSAGDDDAFALILVDKVLLSWADEIVCMDAIQAEKLKETMNKLGVELKPVKSLDIDDSYPYMDDQLQDLIVLGYQQAHPAPPSNKT